MYKKNLKLLLTIFLIVAMLFSFSSCFAEVDGTITKSVTNEATATNEENQTSEEETQQEIHNGDLYIFDNNVVMDKLVDGNVFIFGSNVEVTGQINGNLFVCADTLKFNSSYIRYSIFACANSIYYNGACNDLYAATNHLEMTYDSYVVRDVKAVSASTVFKAAVGRDVDLQTGTVDFGADKEVPVIYGTLRYSANEEKQLAEGIVQGETIYSSNTLKENLGDTVKDIFIGFLTSIATVLVLYLILKKFAPKCNQKLADEKITVLGILKSLGIGLLTAVIVLVLAILLLITVIGVNLAVILSLLFVVICLIAVPTLSIVITNVLKPIFKIEKTSMFCLILALVNIILYGVTLIPYVGFILSIIIKFTGIGMLIQMIMSKKELSEEEKASIEEAKKQATEDEEFDNNKKKKTILIAAGTILLILAVVIVLNLPSLISGFKIFNSSTDAINAATNTTLEQTQNATNDIQQQLQNIIK